MSPMAEHVERLEEGLEDLNQRFKSNGQETPSRE